jgi:UDP-N-acetylmuramoyl-L-alanyl-D-glutamate--2,6-diaminopimelate ligase
MPTFAELLDAVGNELQVLERRGNFDVEVLDVTDDSRAVKPGSLFVAVKGERVDGHAFVEKAIRSGAVGVVTEASMGPIAAAAVRVANSRIAVGVLGSRFCQDPTSKLRMIGVTGTNGKTTTTYVCKALLEAAGRKVGLIGTVAYQIGAERIPASHTTPGALELQRLFCRALAGGLDTVVMEVSSHALALDRTAGSEFDVAVFTNLTQDHLDFHRDMDDYFRSKLRLFSGLGESARKPAPKRAIVNADDPRAAHVTAACRVPVWTYAVRKAADVKAERVQTSLAGTRFMAITPVGRFPVESALVGEHNVYNLLAAVGVALHEGLSVDQVRDGIARVKNVPGRFERVGEGQPFTLVVDYAHTEDALVRLLTAAQVIRTGRIITVFGCGGDRDRTKRPKMGRVAVEFSDVVVLTSDNPRTEDPMAILRDVEVGVKEALKQRPSVRYVMVPDRRQAIEEAVQEARPGDMVLIAGKGHEDYQIIGTQKFHFDDREVAAEAIRHVSESMSNGGLPTT